MAAKRGEYCGASGPKVSCQWGPSLPQNLLCSGAACRIIYVIFAEVFLYVIVCRTGIYPTLS